jgi:hypothetical protein
MLLMSHELHQLVGLDVQRILSVMSMAFLAQQVAAEAGMNTMGFPCDFIAFLVGAALT